MPASGAGKDDEAPEKGPAGGPQGNAAKEGKVISGISWNFAGMIAGTVAGLFTSIILARLLAPIDFGNLALTLSVLNVLVILTALGFEFALNKFIPSLLTEGKPGAILQVVKRLALYKLALAVALSVAIFFAADIIAAHLFQKPQLGQYMRILCLLVVPYSLEPIFRGLLTGFYLQKFTNILDMGVKVLYLLLACAALLLHYGVAGVLYASLLCQTVLLALAARRGLAAIPPGHPGEGPPAIGKVLRYSLFLYVFTIMNFVLGQQLDMIMIGAMMPDISEVAYYTIAYSFSYMALSMLSMALGGGITLTYFSELYAKRDFEGLRRSYTVMVEYMFVYMIPVGIVGAVLAPQLLYLVFGEQYAGSTAVGLLALYFPVMILLKYGGVTSTFMGAMDQERKLVTSRAIFGCSNIILNFILIPYLGAFGALVGTGVASILGLVYESWVVHASLGPRYPVRFLNRMVGLSLASGWAALGLSIVMQRMAPLFGFGRLGETLLVLGVAGGGWLLLTAVLFVALRPLSPETVDVVQKVRFPFKGVVMRLIVPRDGR